MGGPDLLGFLFHAALPFGGVHCPSALVWAVAPGELRPLEAVVLS